MGTFNMKRIRLYWSRRTRIPAIADAMTRGRFFLLRNHLKVVNNDAVPDETKNSDKLWKVRPFLEASRQPVLRLPSFQNVYIDEQIIPFTGRCPSRQFVPRKPNPTGLKNFVLATDSGLVLDFEVYQGSLTFRNFQLDGKPAGQGVGVVLRLTETLPTGSLLFCDRFFVTVPLILHLLEKEIYMT